MAKDKQVELERLIVYRERSRLRMIMRKKIRSIKKEQYEKFKQMERDNYYYDFY